MQEIRVGLVGYKFMGKAHSNAYRQIARFFDIGVKPVLKALCGRDAAGVKAAAEKFGWESYETAWEKLVQRNDIDLVDVSTPGDTHAPISIAAAQAGKAVLCEKPLANTVAEAEAMVKAVQESKVPNMVCFNYRRVPAVTLAKQVISDGTLGSIYHFRATYLQDWIVSPQFPLVWRLQKEIAGSGVLGDLGAHIIDIARYLVGEITEVCGALETFIKERPKLAGTAEGLGAKAAQEMGQVTVDDASLFLGRFENGALGAFEATRFALGRKNYNRFEVNGSKGSLVFNLERMNELELYLESDPDHARGFRTIMVTEGVHPYVHVWWPPGHIIGYEHSFVHTVRDFLEAIVNKQPVAPDFVDGLKCQKVLAAVEKAAEEKRWVPV